MSVRTQEKGLKSGTSFDGVFEIENSNSKLKLVFNLLYISRLSLNTSALVEVHFISGDELLTNLPSNFRVSFKFRRWLFKLNLTVDLLAKYA